MKELIEQVIQMGNYDLTQLLDTGQIQFPIFYTPE